LSFFVISALDNVKAGKYFNFNAPLEEPHGATGGVPGSMTGVAILSGRFSPPTWHSHFSSLGK
jgi:hypothetical protein